MKIDLLRQGKECLSNEEAEAFYTYAFAHYNSGYLAEAVDIFQVLCTRRPMESRFWFGLGAAIQERKQYQDALPAWAMAALLKKEDPYPHFHAAECYFSLQNHSEALKALQEAELKINQNHPLQEKIILLREQWKIDV